MRNLLAGNGGCSIPGRSNARTAVVVIVTNPFRFESDNASCEISLRIFVFYVPNANISPLSIVYIIFCVFSFCSKPASLLHINISRGYVIPADTEKMHIWYVCICCEHRLPSAIYVFFSHSPARCLPLPIGFFVFWHSRATYICLLLLLSLLLLVICY